MSVRYPVMLLVAVLACAGMTVAYLSMHRQRTRQLAALGLAPGPGGLTASTGPGGLAGANGAGAGAPPGTPPRAGPGSGARWRAGVRRHLPPVLMLAALVLLLAGASRPQATVRLPRTAGTVVLAFDVSASMTATDVPKGMTASGVPPTRLAAAKAAATGFVRAQPDAVDVGVVAFDQGALTVRAPTGDHDEVIAAIGRLRAAGGTSLGQAILASLGAILGRQVPPPDPQATAPPTDLGYRGSATIVLLSDGEETGGPDALAAAGLAAAAGVRVQTVGFGTPEGATVAVDGYQVRTALDEALLTEIAHTTAGAYHRAGDAQALDAVTRAVDLRITAKPQRMELTGAVVAAAVLLLTAGGLLTITWYGRVL